METLLIIFFVCAALTNIAGEIIKELHDFKETATLNCAILAAAEVITLACYLAYWAAAGNAITWYLVVAVAVAGVLVAYAAMFGYDKLIKQLLAAVENFRNAAGSEDE